jgi:N-acetylglucosaminyldiphosphoundecaprenol N-acetyl-beta-D-mannosaminyltransferase
VVDLMGVRFQEFTERGCVEHVIRSAASGTGGWIVTPNLHILRECRRHGDVRDLVGRADVVVADGMPLIWASRLQRTPLPERVSGSNLIWSVSEAAARANLRVFFLGGQPGSADNAAQRLREASPALQIVGTLCPPFGFEKDTVAIEAMAREVREARPDIVFVALSFPKGEHLVQRIRSAAPTAWWIGVGISFSFVAGDVKRAPRMIQRVGMEWLFRLSQEPGRHARRDLVEGIPFALSLLAHSAWRGLVMQGRGGKA